MKAWLFTIPLLMGLLPQAQANSSFETLRRAFNNAKTPATIQDFDSNAWQNCLFSDIASPEMTRKTQVRLLQYPSEPGRGPLFPGGSEYRIDVFNDRSLDFNLISFFQASSIEESGVNLIQVLNGPPWRRMNTYGRLDGDFLLFHVEVSDQYGYYAPMYPRVYGYCWNESSRGKDGDDKDGEQPLPPPIPH